MECIYCFCLLFFCAKRDLFFRHYMSTFRENAKGGSPKNKWNECSFKMGKQVTSVFIKHTKQLGCLENHESGESLERSCRGTKWNEQSLLFGGKKRNFGWIPVMGMSCFSRWAMSECQSSVVLMLHSTDCNSCLVNGTRIEADREVRSRRDMLSTYEPSVFAPSVDSLGGSVEDELSPPCSPSSPTVSSASLSGRSAAPGPAVEPRMSGNAFLRPVLPVAAKSETTGSTSVISGGLHSIIPNTK